MIKKQGIPTGTIRRNRFDAMTEGWSLCYHVCPSHELRTKEVLTRKKDKQFEDSLNFRCSKVWSHKILPDSKCHIAMYQECEACITFPDWLKDFKPIKEK